MSFDLQLIICIHFECHRQHAILFHNALVYVSILYMTAVLARVHHKTIPLKCKIMV